MNFKTGPLTASASAPLQSGENTFSWNPILREVFQRTGAPDNPPSNQILKTDSDTYSLTLGLEATDWWDHEVRIGYDKFEDTYHDPLPNPGGMYNVRSRNTNRTSLAWNSTMRVRPSDALNGNVVIGVDRTNFALHSHYGDFADWRDYETPGDAFEREQENVGYFTQMQMGLNSTFFMTAGLRSDLHPENSTQAQTWSPRFGLSAVTYAGDLTLKPRFAWGQAVVVPDNDQVGGDENEFSILLPNLDLRAQKQRGYDLGLDIFWGDALSRNHNISTKTQST